MKRIHYLSGVTISLFIGVHFFNHFMSVFGAEMHIEVMESLRVVYRNIIIETILMAAVLIQIVSGGMLVLTKRKEQKTFYQKVQVYTGLYLAMFLVIHVSAVLSGRLLMGLDTNIYFGVAGLNTFPFSLFFIPYYGLAVLSFFGHLAAMHSQRMKRSVLGLSPKRQSDIILVMGLITMLIIFSGLTNGFSGLKIPDTYKIMTGS
ncbi:MAG: hypothetical protein ABJG41_13760 [Cyclobacteriaceae bacterium]